MTRNTSRGLSMVGGIGLLGLAGWVALAQEPGPGRGQGPGGPPGEREGRGGPMGGGFPPLPILTALDANGDGELSPQEIDNAPAALRTLDRNKDGKLTRDEMLPAFREGGPGGFAGANPEELVDRMMAFDRNKDGKLTRDELPERMRNLLERADTNGDGVVDREELGRLARQRARGGPQGPGGGPGPRPGFGPGQGGPGPGGGGPRPGEGRAPGDGA